MSGAALPQTHHPGNTLVSTAHSQVQRHSQYTRTQAANMDCVSLAKQHSSSIVLIYVLCHYNHLAVTTIMIIIRSEFNNHGGLKNGLRKELHCYSIM